MVVRIDTNKADTVEDTRVEGVTVAAGSTLTANVPTGALALGRARQVVKEGWGAKG